MRRESQRCGHAQRIGRVHKVCDARQILHTVAQGLRCLPDSSYRVTLLGFSSTPRCAAQQSIADQVAMRACTTHGVRQDRGVLGPKPSALVAAVGVGPGGRKVFCLKRINYSNALRGLIDAVKNRLRFSRTPTVEIDFTVLWLARHT